MTDPKISASHIVRCPIKMETTQVFNIFEDGSVQVFCPYVDMGKGHCTAYENVMCCFLKDGDYE